LETPIGAAIAGNVNNAAPNRENAKVKLTTLPGEGPITTLEAAPPVILARREIAFLISVSFTGSLLA
jgi:hypothetical protein